VRGILRRAAAAALLPLAVQAGEGSAPDARAGVLEQIRAEFEALDRDADGVLSPREYARAVEVRRMFETADADGDGRLTFAELVARGRGPGTPRAGRAPLPQASAPRPAARIDTAPAAGSAAPAVKAARLDDGTLVDLAKPKRATVLIFGSHT